MTISALRSCSVRRTFSRRSWAVSSWNGSRLDLGPRFCGVRAWRTPASRSRRHVANSDEYSPSRRSSIPIPPEPLAWSASVSCPREIITARDRKNYGNFRDPVEGLRRYDQHRTAAFLLVSRRRIEADEPDFTALHQMSSPPKGLLSSQSRCSLPRRALGSHWASNSFKL